MIAMDSLQRATRFSRALAALPLQKTYKGIAQSTRKRSLSSVLETFAPCTGTSDPVEDYVNTRFPCCALISGMRERLLDELPLAVDEAGCIGPL